MRRKRRGIDSDRNEQRLLLIIMGFVGLLAVLAVWFSIVGEPGPTVVETGTDLRLPLAELRPGKLHLFTYRIDASTSAELAVQRGKDNILRVAFASCRNCYRFRNYDRFGQLICRRCGHAMLLPDPGTEPSHDAGCTPVGIPYSTDDNELIVRAQAIEEQFQQWYQPLSAAE